MGRKPVIKFRCAALDKDGKQCRQKGTHIEDYHGDGELYWYNDPEPQWVRIRFCDNHVDTEIKNRVK